LIKSEVRQVLSKRCDFDAGRETAPHYLYKRKKNMQFSKVMGKIDPNLVEKAADKLSRIFIDLALKYTNNTSGTNYGGDPFIYTMLSSSEHVCTLSIPTAATDGKRYYWNPNFVIKQSALGLRFICTHEATHALWLHPARRLNRNPKLWNIAVDYIVNGFVLDDISSREFKHKDLQIPPGDLFKKHLGDFKTLEEFADLIKNPFAKKHKDLLPSSNATSQVSLPKPEDDIELTDEQIKEIKRKDKRTKFFYADPGLKDEFRRPERIYDYLYDLMPKCEKCGSIGRYPNPNKNKKKDKDNSDQNEEEKDSAEKDGQEKDSEKDSKKKSSKKDSSSKGKKKDKKSGSKGKDESNQNGDENSGDQDGSQDGDQSGDQDGHNHSDSGSPCDCHGGCNQSPSNGSNPSSNGSSGDDEGGEGEGDEGEGDEDSQDGSCCSGNSNGQGCCDSCDDDLDIFGLGGTVDEHMDVTESQDKIAKKIQDATNVASHSAGRTPAGIEEEVGKLSEAKITWQDEIRSRRNKIKSGNARNDWTRYKTRPMFSGLVVPRRRSYSCTFGCLLDTSGSMSSEDMAYGISQLKSLDQNTEGWLVPADCTIYWDEVTKLKSVKEEDLKKIKIKGRGGTMFSDFFKEYEKNVEPCDFLILITDGYLMEDDILDMKDPGIPVYWIITSGCDFRAPFGKVFTLHND